MRDRDSVPGEGGRRQFGGPDDQLRCREDRKTIDAAQVFSILDSSSAPERRKWLLLPIEGYV
jgi:hypothetical protein